MSPIRTWFTNRRPPPNSELAIMLPAARTFNVQMLD
eukprot:CAMPEP_0179339902 /NCGR_PEP_ID=MMETSP0797-20121207/68978_1 /TAXON_ID=47934 /ORGANISM="Dinophysis acuminata, Strain DAEP01" /LENGTH=35 /DNA_ID= /DNA_START= /DNA_END= /DNA_ORIENTATION=